MTTGEQAEITKLCGQRAANIYTARSYCCAEALLAALHRGFNSEITEENAARLGSGFCHGMGGAGCVCGALAAAQMMIAWFLGPRQPQGMSKKEFSPLAQGLHDQFKERFGATCCRTLLKRRKEQKGAECKELTAGAAEMAASLILAQRPELAATVDLAYLRRRESKLGQMAKQLLGR